jgi:trimethylamine--corrinoid protein Co-methyltransferase
MRKGKRKFNWFPPFATKDDLLTIHETAVKIVEKVGVGDLTPKLLKIYKDAGCEVDDKKNIAKIPESLIMESIKKVPSKFLLPARNSEHDIMNDAGRRLFYLWHNSAPFIQVWNEEKKEYTRRESTEEDLKKWQKTYDYLEEVDYAGPTCAPVDVSKAGLPADVHEVYWGLMGQTKHFWHVGSLENVGYYARLAAEVVGGIEELKKKPIISLHTALLGLRYGKISSMTVTENIEFGLPSSNCGFVQAGVTAPMSIAGSIAGGLAVNLALMVAQQTIHPGIPITQLVTPCVTLDMETGQITPNMPENLIGNIIVSQLWHEFYDKPLVTGGAPAMATSVSGFGMGAQWGWETIMNLFMPMAAGVDAMWAINGHGTDLFIEYGLIFSEMIRFCEHFFRDVSFSSDKLGLDDWLEGGYNTNFLSAKSTIKNMYNWYYPSKHGYGLANRGSMADWLQKPESILDRARTMMKEIEEYEVEPLPKDVVERMNNIMKEADEKLRT